MQVYLPCLFLSLGTKQFFFPASSFQPNKLQFFLSFLNTVFTLRTLVARPAGWAASPTPAPSSAPRTETTTAAPAGAPSWPLGVRCPLNHHSFAPLNSNLAKHCYPPPHEQFISPLRQYKVGCDLQPFASLKTVVFLHLWLICSAGWWFEACGPSNLNGIYYPSSTSAVRYNGIKWYYWKGPNLMATVTTMMVRPANFRQPDIRWGIITSTSWNVRQKKSLLEYNLLICFWYQFI